jgi:ABC-type transport system involved in Fe-S cluster assembly fused permease/ATPase subunit
VKEPISQPEAPVQEVDQGTPAGIELVDPTGELRKTMDRSHQQIKFIFSTLIIEKCFVLLSLIVFYLFCLLVTIIHFFLMIMDTFLSAFKAFFVSYLSYCQH